MQKSETRAASQVLQASPPRTLAGHVRKLLGYSFLFFLAKGLVWTALLAYPLLR